MTIMKDQKEKDNIWSYQTIEKLKGEPRDICHVCGHTNPRPLLIYSLFASPRDRFAVIDLWLCQHCREKFTRESEDWPEFIQFGELTKRWETEFGHETKKVLGTKILQAASQLRKRAWEWIDEQREIYKQEQTDESRNQDANE